MTTKKTKTETEDAVAVFVSVNHRTGAMHHAVFRSSEGHTDPHAEAKVLMEGTRKDFPETEGWLHRVLMNDAANRIRADNMLKNMGLSHLVPVGAQTDA